MSRLLTTGILQQAINQSASGGLLLDLYPNAIRAYSLRQLKSGITNVVRVRRSSDDAQQDFTETQITDGTLTGFCGSGDGFVVTWYDQSGIDDHASQSNPLSQPTIVLAGSVLLGNTGKPTISKPDSADVYLELTQYVALLGSGSFQVYEPKNLGTLNSYTGADSTVRFLTRIATNGNIANRNGGATYNGGVANYGQINLYSYGQNAAGDVYSINNGVSQTGVIAAYQRIGTRLFDIDSTVSGGIDISEIVFYEEDMFANQQKVDAINDNINNHYNIY